MFYAPGNGDEATTASVAPTQLPNYLRKAAGLAWRRTKAASQRRGQVVPLVLRPRPVTLPVTPPATRTRPGKAHTLRRLHRQPRLLGAPVCSGPRGGRQRRPRGARRAWRSLPCHTLPLRRTPRHIRRLSETRNARLARTGTPAAPAPRPPVWPRRWLDRERLSPE